MRSTSAFKKAAPAFLLVALLGCGSSGGPATMNVHLVDGPTTTYSKIYLDVISVSIHGPQGWQQLGTWANGPIDLLSLKGEGVAETLAKGATLPAGHYDQMRLLLGSDSTVVLTDGSTQPLKVPSGMQSGVKLNVSFDVAAGDTKDVFIDFDAERSVFFHVAGSSGQYLLRPVMRAYDQMITSHISGAVTSGAPGATLGVAGIAVSAEVLDAQGNASVVRTVETGTDGSYMLDLLPVGHTYYVVTHASVLPAAPSIGYLATASGPLTVTTSDAPTYSVNVGTAGVADVSGTITPPTGADDVADNAVYTVSLYEALSVGGTITMQSFIVGSTQGIYNGSAETFDFVAVPVGAYSVVASRRTIDEAGVETLTTSGAKPANIPPSVSVTLAFP